MQYMLLIYRSLRDAGALANQDCNDLSVLQGGDLGAGDGMQGGAPGAARILVLHPNPLRFRLRRLGIKNPRHRL
jgi:hypothetical protein